MSTSADFDIAFDMLIGHEGGFQCDPDDTGNWTGGEMGVGELNGTKYGISAASYPDVDIKKITIDDAKKIYFDDYYRTVADMHQSAVMSFVLFDCAVNSGATNTVKILQRAAGVDDDGIFGAVTESAVAAISGEKLAILFLAERLRFMSGLGSWSRFGRGWARRIADNLIFCANENRGEQ